MKPNCKAVTISHLDKSLHDLVRMYAIQNNLKVPEAYEEILRVFFGVTDKSKRKR